jgi:hypothetical protein
MHAHAFDSDRTLAAVAVTFAAVMLVVRWLFALPRWSRDVFVGWQVLTWTATLLVGTMVVLAVLRLVSDDRTVAGGLLAVVALAHAPIHAATFFGLVAVETMWPLAAAAQTIFYPALALLGAVVLLRPLYREWYPPVRPQGSR